MEKRKTIIISASLLATGLAIALFIGFYSFGENEKFFGFPTPKNAQLKSENDIAMNYAWSPASEENGIPFHYKMILKLKGWQEEARENESVYYEKDGHRVDVISAHEFLIVRNVD